MRPFIARSGIMHPPARAGDAVAQTPPVLSALSARQHLPWWPPAMLALLLWLALTLLLALAMVGDAFVAGKAKPLHKVLLDMAIPMLPLAVLGVMLAGLFARTGERWLKPRKIILLFLLLQAIFLPLYMYFEVLVEIGGRGKPLPGIVSALSSVREQFWFIDGVAIGMVFASQLGYALWRHERARQFALQAARSANLALRLSLLQGQLEPQFLLSTLDGISSLVQDAERTLAVRALARLSDLLRYALRASGQAQGQSMADELEFMHHYLALQALRPEMQLQPHWDVAEQEWAGWACPPLLLVPLLDLAIKHAAAQPRLDLYLTLTMAPNRMHWCMQWPCTRPDPGRTSANLPVAAPADLCMAPQYLALATRLHLQFGNAATLRCQQDADICRIELLFPAIPL